MPSMFFSNVNLCQLDHSEMSNSQNLSPSCATFHCMCAKSSEVLAPPSSTVSFCLPEYAALFHWLVLSDVMLARLTGGAVDAAVISTSNLEQIQQHYVGLLNLIKKEMHDLKSELQRLIWHGLSILERLNPTTRNLTRDYRDLNSVKWSKGGFRVVRAGAKTKHSGCVCIVYGTD